MKRRDVLKTMAAGGAALGAGSASGASGRGPAESTKPLSEESSGLGLYIVKTLVGLWGGRVWAESEGRGKGSTFSFTVPKS